MSSFSPKAGNCSLLCVPMTCVLSSHNMCCLSQFLLVVGASPKTPWTAACQAPLSFTVSQSLLKLMSIETMMPSNQLTLCHPLLLLPSIFPSIWSFPVNWLFASSGQSVEGSALASVLPMNNQCLFLLGLTGLISLQSKDSQEPSPDHSSKASVC